uniref:Uncharacterized protein n=1 Tax=Palpitomonas bilix TaxID=652834 RepID=A0A7S3GHM5_9EUKA|mmetsp:Transcript_49843/g.128243  ORF Transcript_49843/g.128243 Transcript_49843/m.128243 type:complete len:312 (+) Transcript_49843:293-1228(+)|eukprot:CAMPEP_0113898842 /NCGR_PEP_ID=MMETSP0780_2-20120614/19651_1 /TAXON_ID=652834 /ORGANISM="Palpitomonas bilix" /LENGTH=311 /DNA_ID=CAMNT_0000890845 /DNA_START=229 /DNA_END=1164 /DNA_ORIENTATION=+ /assembly_acc=CAM_ASM_000599
MSHIEQRKQEFRSYAEAQLRPILEKMVEKAMIALPSDPIDFMITYLQQQSSTSAADVLAAKKQSADGGEKDAEIAKLSDKVAKLELENEELKKASAGGSDDSAAAEVEKLKAENESLKAQVESLKSGGGGEAAAAAEPEVSAAPEEEEGGDKAAVMAKKLDSNRAVYIVGENSTKPKLVEDAISILRGEGKEIELVDVSIATRSHEFYGKWDDEGKWQDSPFTAALRKFQSEGEKAGGLQVVYIKGDVTLFIAEDLKNQVASKDELLIPDDTKLTVPTSVRLIVEVGEHAPNEVPSKCANVVLPNEEEEDE